MVVGDPDEEMQLQIRPVDLWLALDEAASFSPVGGQQAAPVAQETRGKADAADQHRQGVAEQTGSLGAQVRSEVAMVLKVGADFGRLHDHVDA